MTDVRAPSVVIDAVALSEYKRGHLEARPELLLNRVLPSSPIPLSILRRSLRLLRNIDRRPGLYLPRAAGFGLAALIAYQFATLYSVMVTPLDGAPEQAARPRQLQPATLLTSFDPFFTAAASAPAPVTITDLTLYGLRQDRGTGGGSAIISQSDGAQRSFGIGEEIAPGIVVKRVGADHVIIGRHGLEERLAFKEFAPTDPVAATPARAAPSAYGLAPAASPVLEVRPKRPAPRVSTLPARSIDFADPSTLPASLTTPKR